MKLPVLSGKDVIKALKKIGFEEKRQKGAISYYPKKQSKARKQ